MAGLELSIGNRWRYSLLLSNIDLSLLFHYRFPTLSWGGGRQGGSEKKFPGGGEGTVEKTRPKNSTI